MNNKKYSANRCNLRLGEDMETMDFETKSSAVKWAKKCNFAKVRKIKDRSVIFEKNNF